MLWFFAFTTIGIAIFALFLALHRLMKLPIFKMVSGTALLGLCGWLSAQI